MYRQKWLQILKNLPVLNWKMLLSCWVKKNAVRLWMRSNAKLMKKSKINILNFTEKKITNQMNCAMVLIPLVLRALMIK